MQNKLKRQFGSKIVIGGFVLLLTLAFASLSWASTVTFKVAGFSFDEISGEIKMSYSAGVLSFDIWNTSSIDSSITAFAFNVPDGITGIELGGFSAYNNDGVLITASGEPPTAPSGWGYIKGINNEIIEGNLGINTPGNFGFFDIAGVTGPSFNGGKVFPAGIQQQLEDPFIFSFILAGDFDGIDVYSFLTNSEPRNNNTQTQTFVARFQAIGPDNEDSDIGTYAVPIPGAILLLGSGLLSLVGIRKKFIS